MKCCSHIESFRGGINLSHKADESFFERKRPWSKRKDLILGYYLEPYLAKIARLHRPILIVDGFAAPGQFGDGEIGSPLIICQRAQTAIDRGARIKVQCLESVDSLFPNLKAILSPFSFVEALPGEFLQHVPRKCGDARTHTVVLHADPWTVDGLNWDALDSILQNMHTFGGERATAAEFQHASIFARSALTIRRIGSVAWRHSLGIFRN